MRCVWLLPLFAALGACAGEHAGPGVPVEAGGADSGRVLRFYLGSFVEADSVGAVLIRDGTGYRVDTAALGRLAPGLAGELEPASLDGRIDRDELKAAVQARYGAERGLPRTVDVLFARSGYEAGGEGWMSFDVRGSMTPYERRLHIPESAVREALRAFAGPDAALTYPVGTVVIGEHLQEGQVVETTAMIRRVDGFWDFVAYGADGNLAASIAGDPDPLAMPTQCFGCHYGDRMFEPERSFPAPAADGPHGPRELRVPTDWIDAVVVARLDEHRRRDDGLLGVYATLLAGRMRSDREAGTLSAEDEALLRALGL